MTLDLPEKLMQIWLILEVNHLRQIPGKHIKSESSPNTLTFLQSGCRFPSLRVKIYYLVLSMQLDSSMLATISVILQDIILTQHCKCLVYDRDVQSDF